MNVRRGITRQALRLAQRLMRAKFVKGEEGTSLVELAISVPIMMMLLTGAASFSLAFYSLQQLGSATANAAQVLAAEQGLITDPCANVVTSVTTSLPNWTASKLTYTVSITDSGGTAHTTPATTGSSFSCNTYAAYMAQNEPVTVTVSYSYSWLPIFKFTPSSALTASETAMAN